MLVGLMALVLQCLVNGNATGMQPHGTYIYKDGQSAWLRERLNERIRGADRPQRPPTLARVKEEKVTELIYIKMDGARS